MHKGSFNSLLHPQHRTEPHSAFANSVLLFNGVELNHDTMCKQLMAKAACSHLKFDHIRDWISTSVAFWLHNAHFLADLCWWCVARCYFGGLNKKWVLSKALPFCAIDRLYIHNVWLAVQLALHRPPSVMTVALWCEESIISQLVAPCTHPLVSCSGFLLQPDLLPSASPCTRTYSTLDHWWAVSHRKTKQYNQLRAGKHGRLLLPVFSGLSSHFSLQPHHIRYSSPAYQSVGGFSVACGSWESPAHKQCFFFWMCCTFSSPPQQHKT